MNELDRGARPAEGASGLTQQKMILALEDGRAFFGYAVRPPGRPAADWRPPAAQGELVFCTAMTGYQEICSDPSYRGQLVVLTYPLINNYGVNPADRESTRPWLHALLVREYCPRPSNWRATDQLAGCPSPGCASGTRSPAWPSGGRPAG